LSKKKKNVRNIFLKMRSPDYRSHSPEYRRDRSRSPEYRRNRSPPRPYSRRSPSPRYREYFRRRSPSPRNSYGRRNYGNRHYSPSRRRRNIIVGSESERRNSSTLFVGNLPYHFHEREVRELFERYGHVKEITIGINKRTGQSKGYAFVMFLDRRDAETAFEKLDGINIEGRSLRLDWDIGYEKKQTYSRGPDMERAPKFSPRQRSPSSPRKVLSPRYSPKD